MNNTPQQAENIRLDTALTAGAVVLTPNYLSSIQLQNHWCRYTLNHQHSKIIATPAIFAIDLWLEQLWQTLALHCTHPKLAWHLLQPAQELLLWQQVIRESDAGANLLNIDGTAHSTRETLLLLQQWQIPLAELKSHVSRQHGHLIKVEAQQIFLLWLESFIGLNISKKVLTFSAMLQVLFDLAETEPATLRGLLPDRLVLSGFTDSPPLYRNLLNTFSSLGVDQESWQTLPSSPTISVYTYNALADECRAVTVWATAVLQDDPAASIGIICPDIQKVAPVLDRMFSQSLTESAVLSISCPLNQSLADLPFIATALQLLEFNQDQCVTLNLCQLLRSPWVLGATAEADARAALEFQLRKHGELHTNLASFRQLCLQQERLWYSPLLGQALLQLAQQRRPLPTKQTFEFWMRFFQQQWSMFLDEEKLLSTGNPSLVRAWHKLQANLLQSNFLVNNCTLKNAQALASRFTHNTPSTTINTSAPIQILGPVGSSGMRFTHLWCMQMTEQHWPGEHHINPWLPLILQKKAQFPELNPQALVEKAELMLKQLIASTASSVVCSYAVQMDDLPVRPTKLLPSVTVLTPPPSDFSSLHPAVFTFTKQQELFKETLQLSMQSDLLHEGSGSVLADQAACPFRAFAKHRLQVRELPKLQLGLSASVVGESIHNVLQYFWYNMQSSQLLHETTATSLEAQLNTAIKFSLADIAKRKPYTMTPRYQKLELERLHKLLLTWLDSERQRGHFTIVANELKTKWKYENLQLNLRIDRIDRNADGSLTVIDYKTGKLTKPNWQEERPEAPQLLLYQEAATQQLQAGPVTALLFAHISSQEQQYLGIGCSDQALANIDFNYNKSVNISKWVDLQLYWQHSLQQLAQEYLDGELAIKPLHSKTCEYCHLHSFCRIAELSSLA